MTSRSLHVPEMLTSTTGRFMWYSKYKLYCTFDMIFVLSPIIYIFAITVMLQNE